MTLRIAVPTIGDRGMIDTVSDVFSRAENFTILEVEGGEIREVRTEKNTASTLKQGAGPLAVNNLKEMGVDTVLSAELGPGAKTLLKAFDIKIIKVESGITVCKAVKDALEKFEA